MGTIKTKQVTERIWLMDDNGESTGFVVLGTEKAMVIDTMNGSEDVKAVAESITSLPLIVVNTHSHPDHIGGNHFFTEAYMHPDDVPFIPMFTRPELLEKQPMIHEIKEGYRFDLGDLHLSVYDLPGHTPGSICLLLEEDRILFTGDAINHHLWMQLEGCLPLSEYSKKLARLDFLKEKADYILHGHTQGLDPVSLLTDLERGIRELVEQKDLEVTKADPAYHWFGGEDKMHAFDENSVVCYKESNIR